MQVDLCEFKVSLDYRVSSRIARVTTVSRLKGKKVGGASHGEQAFLSGFASVPTSKYSYLEFLP